MLTDLRRGAVTAGSGVTVRAAGDALIAGMKAIRPYRLCRTPGFVTSAANPAASGSGASTAASWGTAPIGLPESADA